MYKQFESCTREYRVMRNQLNNRWDVYYVAGLMDMVFLGQEMKHKDAKELARKHHSDFRDMKSLAIITD